MDAIEESMPISVIGTGADMNKATNNGLERAVCARRASNRAARARRMHAVPRTPRLEPGGSSAPYVHAVPRTPH